MTTNNPRPNIVFILADDLGWADLSVYGQTDFKTPNLDQLAGEGVRFTQAYANSAVCSDTSISRVATWLSVLSVVAQPRAKQCNAPRSKSRELISRSVPTALR